jgi:hypothetical protein
VALVPLPPEELRGEQLWSRITGALLCTQAGLLVVLTRRALCSDTSVRSAPPQPS